MIFSLECDYTPSIDDWAGIPLWHPNINGHYGYNIYDIQLKKQVNHADSLTFTIPREHPEYVNFNQSRSLGITVGLRADGSNQFIFFGRCVSVDKGVDYQKKITCEGAMAFLNDVMLRPGTFATVEGKDNVHITDNTKSWQNYANFVMAKYNGRLTQAYGHMSKRHISIYDFNPMILTPTGESVEATTKRYSGIDDYMPVMDAVNDLIGVDTRFLSMVTTTLDTATGKVYSAIYAGCPPTFPYRDNLNAVMSLDQNVIDVGESGNSFDSYTALIPLGKDKRCLDYHVNTTKPEFKNNECWHADFYASDSIYGLGIGLRGYIEKTIEIPEIELDPDGRIPEGGGPTGYTLLNNKAEEILSNSGEVEVREYSVNAVDLSLLCCTEREPYTANTPAPQIYDILGRTWDDISNNPTKNPIHVTSLDHSGSRSGNSGDPVEASPATLALNGDLVIFGNGIYMFNQNEEWEYYADARYLNHQSLNQQGIYKYDYLNGDNFIDICDRVHFTCEALGIYDEHEEVGHAPQNPWICTSLSMSIDNQAATSYTFSIVNTTYMPSTNYEISELMKNVDANRIKSKQQKVTNGTPVKSEIQPTDVIKIDDNHVVEIYSDREIHYVAEGEGDIRTNVRSYEMPVGTTDPDDPFPTPNDNS